MEQPLITVIGSINMDMVTVANKIPEQGETVLGDQFKTVPGGKGANQAIAAARLGGNVQFIGKLGEDAFGTELLQNFRNEGISQLFVAREFEESTGVATILLTEKDNRIIVTPGANKQVTPEYIEKHKEVILKSKVVLLQFEIPMDSIKYCLDLCAENSIPVILNPAPAYALPDQYWLKATFITPNETEAQQLFGNEEGYNPMLKNKMIITKGKDGVSFMDDGEYQSVSAFHVNVVDTTGAGDTFNGALTVALAEGKVLAKAIQFANGAAALSIKKFGAQGGMPKRMELENFLYKSNNL